MSEKELRRLTRSELLEVILRQREEIEKLEAKLTEATARLDARYIRLDVCNPGTWEETAHALACVLEKEVSAADASVDEPDAKEE